ncbi:hypothetical protein CRE_21071 [Caenorhabditis remanei]|uniref:Uncharacterized protein n=1 Tax=Caenorhabditis remanei TaxID=31234 RepID=E3NRA1_CAERE|nr:hypothetical protein CRE_21071 [Caenorhabditis remanei]
MGKFFIEKHKPIPTKIQKKDSNALKTRINNSFNRSLKQCGKEASTHIESDKLMKFAKELMKSHPELSMEQALRIEKQRQNDRKKRAEEVVVDPYKIIRIEDEFEKYMKEAKSDKNEEMKENREIRENFKKIVEDMEEED